MEKRLKMAVVREEESGSEKTGAVPHVVIVGAGFGGLQAARALRHAPVRVTVIDRGPLHLTGFLAWVMWLVVHIFYLIGFRNRLLVMFQWAWEYLTRQRSARLITCGDATEPSSWQQLTLTSTLQESSVCHEPAPQQSQGSRRDNNERGVRLAQER